MMAPAQSERGNLQVETADSQLDSTCCKIRSCSSHHRRLRSKHLRSLDTQIHTLKGRPASDSRTDLSSDVDALQWRAGGHAWIPSRAPPAFFRRYGTLSSRSIFFGRVSGRVFELARMLLFQTGRCDWRALDGHTRRPSSAVVLREMDRNRSGLQGGDKSVVCVVLVSRVQNFDKLTEHLR
ncbi:hypothetical protein BC567DRAFT_74303 [Phyllosticta citribraziliensis]